MKHDIKKYFRTYNRLQALINSGDSEFDEWCEQYLADLYEIKLEGYSELPYWIDVAGLHGASKETDSDDYLVEYRVGYHEPFKLGHTKVINGTQYKYVDSVPLNQEIELQAGDGRYVHAYVGESFLRVWEAVK